MCVARPLDDQRAGPLRSAPLRTRYGYIGYPSLVDRHPLLDRNSLSTFSIRFEGDAMSASSIKHSLVCLPQYRNGHIVSVFIEGEHFVRRLEKQGNGDARESVDIIVINKEGVKQCGR
jgi:hypothetical protein